MGEPVKHPAADDVLTPDVDRNASIMNSADAAEGVAAFLERRAPVLRSE